MSFSCPAGPTALVARSDGLNRTMSESLDPKKPPVVQTAESPPDQSPGPSGTWPRATTRCRVTSTSVTAIPNMSTIPCNTIARSPTQATSPGSAIPSSTYSTRPETGSTTPNTWSLAPSGPPAWADTTTPLEASSAMSVASDRRRIRRATRRSPTSTTTISLPLPPVGTSTAANGPTETRGDPTPRAAKATATAPPTSNADTAIAKTTFACALTLTPSPLSTGRRDRIAPGPERGGRRSKGRRPCPPTSTTRRSSCSGSSPDRSATPSSPRRRRGRSRRRSATRPTRPSSSRRNAGPSSSI